jgi:UDP-N-acetylmuramyl pentapeptide phosphotransferase/UDP-N-acetylglucosamine-1-phosphate transferase
VNDIIRVLLLIIASVSIVIISAFWVRMIKYWAERRHILDIPNERSSHKQPIPRGGGVVIVGLSMLGWCILSLLMQGYSLFSNFYYLVGGFSIAIVSWYDDLKSLPYQIRFSVHLFGALLVILVFGYWQAISLPVIGIFDLGYLGIFVTLIWLVGLTNAYNFMDGIDGMAGGQAVIAGLGWAIVGWVSGQWFILYFGLIIAATSLGFLVYNWSPAKIFMGDVGSAFLGFTFATLPLLAMDGVLYFHWVGLFMVWPFVADTSFTFIRRLIRREPVFSAHRSHIYQRLVISGMSHRAVVLLYMGLALVGTILGIAVLLFGQVALQVGLLVIFILFLILVYYTLYKETLSLNQNYMV